MDFFELGLWGVLWVLWLIKEILLVIWFPVSVVGLLYFLQESRLVDWVSTGVILVAVLLSPILPATGFRLDKREFISATIFVYLVGALCSAILGGILGGKLASLVRRRSQKPQKA